MGTSMSKYADRSASLSASVKWSSAVPVGVKRANSSSSRRSKLGGKSPAARRRRTSSSISRRTRSRYARVASSPAGVSSVVTVSPQVDGCGTLQGGSGYDRPGAAPGSGPSAQARSPNVGSELEGHASPRPPRVYCPEFLLFAQIVDDPGSVSESDAHGVVPFEQGDALEAEVRPSSSRRQVEVLLENPRVRPEHELTLVVIDIDGEDDVGGGLGGLEVDVHGERLVGQEIRPGPRAGMLQLGGRDQDRPVHPLPRGARGDTGR